MNRFEQTSIWQKALGKQLEPDIFVKERDFLRVEFEKFREKAKLLAAEIALVLPDFSVHDITHVDALWETAELVARDDFEITPAEAFVLGGTFLIHDLGMGLASFPNGIDELKKEAIWNDTVTSILKVKLKRQIKEQDFINIDKGIEKIATENVLRLLHAKHAEKLALVSWKNNAGIDIFLIENTDLRESYGSIIGLIAHSHWCTVEELITKLPKTLGAPGIFPSSWTVDAVKLACILRIADATQVDDRRAPSFLRTIRKPSSYSDLHWNFQQKLYQPRLERNRLVYTSKSPFPISEVDSWWVCHDTLKMIDNELKEVDSLLVDTNRQRLKAIGVASIEDPKRLSKLIAVEGWQPIDTKIKVTNVAKLVGSLGGKQLYGDNVIVPLRELIQNASDAIRARRILENESQEFGNIIISFGNDKNGQFIEVEDNGIGMSSRVLSGPFLDFGESFWGTSLMHEELPGLESKGFSPTGKYGIGFFSVFMWGEKVSVSTKRFENGRDTTIILEFNKGASSRPILRRANDNEIIKDGGTRIRVWLSNSNILDKLLERKERRKNKISKIELIKFLCPSIDCNVFIDDNGKKRKIIKANDWIKISAIDLIKRLIGLSYFNSLPESKLELLSALSNNMEVITSDTGEIVGRAFLFVDGERRKEDLLIEGTITVGGFSTTGLNGLIGVFIGENIRASRDIALPIISNECLKNWANSQACKLQDLFLKQNIQIECASYIRRCGGNTKNLKIAYHKNGELSYLELVETLKKYNFDEIYVVQDAAIFNYERENKYKINFHKNIIWVEKAYMGIIQTKHIEHFVWWPESNIFEETSFNENLAGLVNMALCEVWNCSIDELLLNSLISTDEKSYKGIVGNYKRKPVTINHLDIMKKPK